MGYRDVVVTDTPVGYWRFGEASGTNANDEIGSLDGAYVGSPTLGVVNQFVGDGNTGITVNGTSQYVTIPDNAVLDVGDTFSIEFWIKCNTDTDRVLMSKGTGGWNITRTSADGGDLTLFKEGTAGAIVKIIGLEAFGAWHHVVFTKANGKSAAYLDGRNVGQVGTNQTFVDTASTLYFGGNGSDYFSGSLDELAIYNKALSAAQVEAHYAAAVSKYANIVLRDSPSAYWRLGDHSIPFFDCGFEDALTTTHWSFGGAGGGESLDTTTFKSGAKSLRFQTTSGQDRFAYVNLGPSASAALRFSLRLGTLPSPVGFTALAKINGSSIWNLELGIDASNHLVLKPNPIGTGSSVDYGLVSTGTWYDIDMFVDGTAMTAGWRVNGVSQPSPTMPNTTETFDGPYIGPMYGAVQTNNMYFDDVAYSVLLADYPLSGYANSSDRWVTLAQDRLGTSVGTFNPSNEDINGFRMPGAIVGDPDTACGFNGRTYIAVTDNAALDLGDTFSIEFWIKRSAFSTNMVLLQKGTGVDSGYQVWINSANTVNLADGAGNNVAYADPGIADNHWHHIVFTKSGSTRNAFVDGVANVGLGTNRTLTDNTSALAIGSIVAGGGNFFSGHLDEVALYKTALTAEKVAAHYALGVGQYAAAVRMDSPSAYWRLGDKAVTPTFDCGFEDAAVTTHWTNSGNAVLDSSITGRTGTNAVRLDVANTAVANYISEPSGWTANYVTVVRFRFRFSALPTAAIAIAKLNGQAYYDPYIYYEPYDQTLQFSHGSNYNGAGPVIAANTWYTVEFATDGANRRGWWSVDGVQQPSPGPPLQGDTNDSLYLGKYAATAAGAFSLYFDDVVVSHTLADYPIGDGWISSVSDNWETFAVDETPNARDGICINSPVLGVAGALVNDTNSAVRLTAAQQNHVKIVSYTTIPSPVSIEAWFYGASFSDTGLAGWYSSASLECMLYLPGTGVRFTCGASGSYVHYNVETNDSKWHHLAGTYDGTNARLYLDGVLVAGPTALTMSGGTSTYPFLIGQYGAPWGTYSNISIDDVAAYSTALSASQVSEHYALGSSRYAQAVLINQPVAYWRLGEASGLFNDSSGRDHPATASGTPTRNVANTSIFSEDDGGVSFAADTDYLTVTDHADIDLGNGPFSIEFWAKRTSDISGTGWSMVLGKGTNGYAIGVAADSSGSGDRMSLTKDQVAHISSCAPSIVPLDEWHHWVMVRNGTSDTVWYYDGAITTTTYDGAVALADTAVNLTIGKAAGGDLGWRGALDEMAFYKSALTAAQVAERYAARLGSYTQLEYVQELLADGPTFILPMAEASGVLTDIVGNKVANATGSPTYGATGPVSGYTAIDFPAGTDYFTVPDHTDLDLGDGPYTIEVWYARDGDNGSYQGFVVKGNNAYAVGINPNDQYNHGKMNVAEFINSGGTTVAVDSVWHHVAVTKVTGTGTGRAKMYVDGVLRTQETDTTTTLADTSDPLTIGREVLTQPALGKIAWVTIYKSALPSTRIVAHYDAALGDEIVALVGSIHVMLGGGL